MIRDPIDRRKALLTRLYRVPHLQLKTRVNLSGLRSELRRIPNFYTWNGYNYKYPDHRALNNLNLDVVGIFDYFRDSTLAGEHPAYIRSLNPDIRMNRRAQPTDLGEKSPVMVRTIKTLVEEPSRCVVSRLRPGHEVPWHRHEVPERGWLHHNLVIHFPICAEPGCRNAVRDHRAPDPVYYQAYEPGTAWVLNTFHDHYAINESDQERYHLWVVTTLVDPLGIPINDKLVRALEIALDAAESPIDPPTIERGFIKD